MTTSNPTYFYEKGFRRIYDDFLPPEMFNALKTVVTDPDFPWTFRLGVVHRKQRNGPTFGLSHLAWHPLYGAVSPMRDELYNHLYPVFQKLFVYVPMRVKFNLGVKVRDKHIETGHHIDVMTAPSNFRTAILYLDDSNGYTQFEADKAPVKSKSNRMLIFDGQLRHQAVTQTDTDVRYVCNFNYLSDKIPEGGKSFDLDLDT